jgi:hypothetical protein
LLNCHNSSGSSPCLVDWCPRNSPRAIKDAPI